MKRRIATTVLIAGVGLAFLVNLIGWNLYAYFNFGEKDLILASALGAGHIAWAEHFEEEMVSGVDLPISFTATILDVGFLNLFLERRGDRMTPFGFRLIQPTEFSDYRGFEFPWLLLLVVPIAFHLAWKRRRRLKTEGQRQ